MNKKAQTALIQNFAMGLVITGVLIAFGLLILGNVQETFNNTSSPEAIAVSDTITGMGTLSENLPIIALIIVAVIVISLLVGIGARRKA